MLGHRTCVCCFCQKPFARADVLRRHYQRCPLRSGQQIPPKLQPGRRMKACDQCAERKLACDADFPCGTCLQNGNICSGIGPVRKNGLLQMQRRPRATQVNELLTPYWLPAHFEINNLTTSRQCDFSFLLALTNPSQTSLATGFGVKTESDLDLVRLNKLGKPSSTLDLDFNDSLQNGTGMVDEFGEVDLANLCFYHDPNSPDSLLKLQTKDISSDDCKRLTKEADIGTREVFLSAVISIDNIGHMLVDELIYHSVNRSTCTSTSIFKDDVNAACQLFLSGQTPLFIHIYFSKWNHHSPIVHRATFNVAETTPPLLLAISLTGALLSTDDEYVTWAKQVLDLAERYVFDHGDFLHLLQNSEFSPTPLEHKYLNIVQAAHAMIQIQFRNASLSKRRSLREEQLSKLILASKALGLNQHDKMSYPFPQDLAHFDWHQFSIKEAGIRTMCGIFNMEASLSIFYDTAPRMMFEEIATALPCPLDAYMASRAEDCFSAVVSRLPESKLRTSEVGVLLCSEDETSTTSLTSQLDVLHLFVLILGLLQSLWLLEEQELSYELRLFMSRGLARWKQAWDKQISSLSVEKIEGYGFSKDAAIEYWNLAVYMLSKGYTRISRANTRKSSKSAYSPEPISACYNTLKRIAGIMNA